MRAANASEPQSSRTISNARPSSSPGEQMEADIATASAALVGPPSGDHRARVDEAEDRNFLPFAATRDKVASRDGGGHNPCTYGQNKETDGRASQARGQGLTLQALAQVDSEPIPSKNYVTSWNAANVTASCLDCFIGQMGTTSLGMQCACKKLSNVLKMWRFLAAT